MTTQKTKAQTAPSTDFIRAAIQAHMESNRFQGRVVTRFPPEPNGQLHIGHTKAAFINFGIAEEYGGACHLRFDDTNPAKEDEEFVRAIQEDLRWLGFDWGEHLYYASDYFEQLYEFAIHLIKAGLAYVCDLSQDEIRQHRGTFTQPGVSSPYRERSVEENLDLFRRMRAGEFDDGARVLRAKIDMASGNLNLRDPVLYRILHVPHQRTGDKWCIYPTYDFAHGQSDSIEGITHSLCSLEFEDHRPLYDWLIEKLGHPPSSADRVRPPEPDPHGDEQAQASGTGGGRLRVRLGRPPNAHPLRHASAGLHPGGPLGLQRKARAWPSGPTPWRFRCWNTACERT